VQSNKEHNPGTVSFSYSKFGYNKFSEDFSNVLGIFRSLASPIKPRKHFVHWLITAFLSSVNKLHTNVRDLITTISLQIPTVANFVMTNCKLTLGSCDCHMVNVCIMYILCHHNHASMFMYNIICEYLRVLYVK